MSFVDRNASSKLRLRRNSQRARKGDATSSIAVTAPLTNTASSLGLAIPASGTGGLAVTANKLSLLLGDLSLSLGAGGLRVAAASPGGITTSAGVGILLADTSLALSLSGVAVNLATNSGLVVSSGLAAQLADSSLQTSGTGLSVHLAANSGLAVAGGLVVQTSGTSLIISGGGLLVNLAASSGLQIASGLAVKAADTSIGISASGINVALRTNSGLFTSTGLGVSLLDTSLTTSGGLGVNLATNSGLQIVSGLTHKIANTGLALSSSGIGVNLAGSGGLTIASGLLVKGFRGVSTDPVSPADGDSWYNTTGAQAKVRYQGLTSTLPLMLLAAGQGSAVTNSTVFTALSSTVVLPVNFFQVGRIIHVRSTGLYAAKVAPSPTLTIGAFVDTTNTLGDGPTITLGGSAGGRFFFDISFTCIAVGAVATIRTGGLMYVEVGGVVTPFTLGNTLNVDTTTSLTIEAVAKWSLADPANTITAYNCEIEVIG